MLILSELLIGNHQLESFDELLALIIEHARNGEIFIEMDVKPTFPDTPEHWEQQIENAFTSASLNH